MKKVKILLLIVLIIIIILGRGNSVTSNTQPKIANSPETTNLDTTNLREVARITYTKPYFYYLHRGTSEGELYALNIRTLETKQINQDIPKTKIDTTYSASPDTLKVAYIVLEVNDDNTWRYPKAFQIYDMDQKKLLFTLDNILGIDETKRDGLLLCPREIL